MTKAPNSAVVAPSLGPHRVVRISRSLPERLIARLPKDSATDHDFIALLKATAVHLGLHRRQDADELSPADAWAAFAIALMIEFVPAMAEFRECIGKGEPGTKARPAPNHRDIAGLVGAVEAQRSIHTISKAEAIERLCGSNLIPARYRGLNEASLAKAYRNAKKTLYDKWPMLRPPKKGARRRPSRRERDAILREALRG